MSNPRNITINYNGNSLFDQVSPIPFISFEQEFLDYKNINNQITRLSFEGQITGKYIGSNSFNYLNESLERLLNRLKDNFKPLSILSGVGTPQQTSLFTTQCAIVENVSIDPSPWVNILPFTIDFVIYESGLFNDYFNIIDPVQTLDFRDIDLERTELKYRVGAKGLRTSNRSAVENAKLWTISKTGEVFTSLSFYNYLRPNSVPSFKEFLLKNVNEDIDRINGSYYIEFLYERSNSFELFDDSQNVLTNYTVDISSGIQDNLGYITAQVKGSLENNNIDILDEEAELLTSKSYSWAALALAQSVPGTALSFDPENYNITRYPNQNKIEFEFTYNNDFWPGNIIKNYEISFNTDYLTNITTANLNAIISAKRGPLKQRILDVEEAYASEKENFYTLILTDYIREGYQKILNFLPEQESISKNDFNGTITYQASWTDKLKKYPDTFLSFESNVQYDPSRKLYAKATSAYFADQHNIQDLNNASRARLSITANGSLRKNNPNDNDINDAKDLLLQEIVRIRSNFTSAFGAFKLYRENSNFNVTKGLNPVNISLTESWTFNGTIYQ